jgi:hypothetical protein
MRRVIAAGAFLANKAAEANRFVMLLMAPVVAAAAQDDQPDQPRLVRRGWASGGARRAKMKG